VLGLGFELNVLRNLLDTILNELWQIVLAVQRFSYELQLLVGAAIVQEHVCVDVVPVAFPQKLLDTCSVRSAFCWYAMDVLSGEQSTN